MSELASGVVIVTCLIDGRPWGMTVTSFASVSAGEPTVLVSLGSETASARAILEARSFGVSILDREQVEVARYCATAGANKFLEPFVERGGASPAIAGAPAHLDCELTDAVHVADHTVLVGRVLGARKRPTGNPLVYHRRGYRALAEPERSVTWLWS